MINSNKWTDKSKVTTGTLQNFEYMKEQGANNVKMDLEETGYKYWTELTEISVMFYCGI